MHIFVRSVFKGDDILYPELFLDKTLCVKVMEKMKFGANKTPTEVIKEGSLCGTYFRDIYSGINGNWYRKSWKEFDQLKDSDQKFYRSDCYDISVNNKYSVKCGTSLRFWENKGWINGIGPYDWFQWYFRYQLGRRSEDEKRKIIRWKKL